MPACRSLDLRASRQGPAASERTGMIRLVRGCRSTEHYYGSNMCCLDYSVAKDGVLAAYQFDGEAEVDIKKFVTV